MTNVAINDKVKCIKGIEYFIGKTGTVKEIISRKKRIYVVIEWDEFNMWGTENCILKSSVEVIK